MPTLLLLVQVLPLLILNQRIKKPLYQHNSTIISTRTLYHLSILGQICEPSAHIKALSLTHLQLLLILFISNSVNTNSWSAAAADWDAV